MIMTTKRLIQAAKNWSCYRKRLEVLDMKIEEATQDKIEGATTLQNMEWGIYITFRSVLYHVL